MPIYFHRTCGVEEKKRAKSTEIKMCGSRNVKDREGLFINNFSIQSIKPIKSSRDSHPLRAEVKFIRESRAQANMLKYKNKSGERCNKKNGEVNGKKVSNSQVRGTTKKSLT
jgi:hypothetical protein